MPKPGFFKLRDKYRNMLLDLAAEVFLSKDYKKLKVADFCTGMDLPTGTFYEYFENVEDLCVYLASLTYQKTFDDLGMDNILLFRFREPGFSLQLEQVPQEKGITYEKILHCGTGFFAKLFEDYLLDMMVPHVRQGLEARMNAGEYRRDVDMALTSYICTLLTVFIFHYFDHYEIDDLGERERAMFRLLDTVDNALRPSPNQEEKA